MCPKCHSLYHFADCYTKVGGNLETKSCSYISFPNHWQKSKTKHCNQALLKSVILQEKTKLYPHKVFCYKSIKESIENIWKREDFEDMIKQWQLRKIPHGKITDIYDGKVWGEIQTLMNTYEILSLMLNMDFFQPFKHTTYSVGVIFLSIMNLPRAVRFKSSNIILVAIIPGPKEPSAHAFYSYLKPLALELKDLWENGMTLTSKQTGLAITVRACVTCVSCDIPAMRKVLGFVSCMAEKGCPRCEKTFTYNTNLKRMIFSGFETCRPRDIDEHRQNVKQIIQASTATERNQLEKIHGCRDAPLLILPYFDCIRFGVIDPMHNLYLGTAKHMMKLWTNSDSPTLRPNDMLKLEQFIEGIQLPTSLGRIPSKIATSFSGFTANQWKHWTLLLSLTSLKSILPPLHYSCWQKFVHACYLISPTILDHSVTEQATQLFREFGELVQDIYGEHAVTPNMHLHLHLGECISDYGPISGYWLFPFERMNGVLGGYHTNQRSVEIQIFRQHLATVSDKNKLLTPEDQKHIADILDDAETTMLSNMPLNSDITKKEYELSYTDIINTDMWFEHHSIICLPPFGREMFDAYELEQLSKAYKTFLPTTPDIIPSIYEVSKEAQFFGHRLGSATSRNKRSAYICAAWVSPEGSINGRAVIRPGQIQCEYMQCKQNLCILHSIY